MVCSFWFGLFANRKIFTEGSEENEDSVYGLFRTTRGARLRVSIWALTF
jgi:hypothetical protein